MLAGYHALIPLLEVMGPGHNKAEYKAEYTECHPPLLRK